MINEEKVKYMTKAAAYEEGPEKKNIKIDSYFRSDYLGLQLVKSGLAYTAAFFMLAAMWIMGRIEEVLLEVSQPDYLEGMVKLLLFLYLVGLFLYEIAVCVYYSKKYQSAKQSVKGFHAYLKRIHKFYEAEESVGESAADEENSL